jgi:hypothetical protein
LKTFINWEPAKVFRATFSLKPLRNWTSGASSEPKVEVAIIHRDSPFFSVVVVVSVGVGDGVTVGVGVAVGVGVGVGVVVVGVGVGVGVGEGVVVVVVGVGVETTGKVKVTSSIRRAEAS